LQCRFVSLLVLNHILKFKDANQVN